MTSEESEIRQPQSKTELFVAFTLMALQGVGGVLVIVQHELVNRRKWLTQAQFVEEWSVAQVMPGPNVVNLCLMLGGKYFGLAGALAAVSGLIMAPMLLVLTLAILFGGVSDSAVAQGALKGMGAVSGGLIIATGLKLSKTMPQNPLGLWLAITFALITFAAVGIFRISLIWVLLGLGLLACLLTYRALGITSKLQEGDTK
ncbi:chromate transporter [Limnohabitans sp. Hippo4]|jgi:chromate transporter|uniref:chromate transporter n=1 Tax=Limnohabitans sp. Hippo4 TaxID=1826167 RepID=UPI000D33D729|nr:chromate transporter [Limnohabitans sp. Hippo4]PUE37237.1 chromate transporter [Limnohabitans sp. Hippo4]